MTMKTIFFDVDTQLDFLYPAGALHVPGAENIVKPLAELTRFAAANRIQILSTADAHAEDDAEFKTWRPHCVVGTVGQQKISATLLPKAVVLSTASDSLPRIQADVHGAPQIIVEKQMVDCFTNPNLRPLLNLVKASRYVVYGVIAEYCVQCAAFGLLETGVRVDLVTDAIQSLSSAEGREIIERFQAHGGELTTVANVTA